MKNTRFTMFCLALATGLFVLMSSCTNDESIPIDGSFTTKASANANGPSANGQGSLTLADGTQRRFAFHANTMPDGSVKGSGVLTYTAGGLKIKFSIDCIKIDENNSTIAMLSGTIDSHSLNPEFEGTTCWFVTQDNGEGNNADPDLLRLLQLGIIYEGPYCDLWPNPGTLDEWGALPIEGGNIQVKN